MSKTASLSVVFCFVTIAASATPTQCSLPQPAQAALGNQWQGWRLLQLADLRSDDQTLWRLHPLNGKHCPGVHEGKFDGVHTGFVFILVKFNPEEQVIMVARSDGQGGYTTTVLAKPTTVSYFSVVNIFPPGKYKDVYTGRGTRIRTDSAVIEAIEAGITLFYFEGGHWRSLQVSD